jgi:hypothetical protein
MNKFRLVALALLLGSSAPSAWAWVGGPWDQLTRDSFSRYNTDGLYEASVSLRNGVGFMRFTVDSGRNTLESSDAILNQIQAALLTGGSIAGSQLNNTSSLAASSNTMIFYRGNAYVGNVYGTVNNVFKIVTGAGSGQSAMADQIQRSINTTGGGTGTAQNIFVNLSGIAETMNISFNGNVTKEVPELRFQATGSVQFFNRPPLEVVNTGGLTQIRIVPGSTPGGFLTPAASETCRIFGGRMSLQTDFGIDFAQLGGAGS